MANKFFIAFICFFTFTILQINALTDSTKCIDKAESTCTTPECIHSASDILKNIDQTQDPCDSFYNFACGNFPKQHVIADDQSMITGYSVIGDDVKRQIKHMLEEPVKDGEARSFVMAKHFYNVCYDTKAINDNGVTPLLSILTRLGGWPVIEGSKWKEENFDWKTTVYKLQNEAFNAFTILPILVAQNALNSSQYMIKMDQAILEVNRESMLKGFDNELVAAYYDYVVELSVLMGADRDAALTQLKEVIEFEMELAKITISSEEQRNASLKINQMTVGELQTRFNGIPWVEFINNVLKDGDVDVAIDDVVDVTYPSYVTNLIAILNHTSERVLHNHFLMHVVMDTAPLLSKKFQKARGRYQEATSGTKVMEPRWSECVNMVNQQMQIATSALYIRKYFTDASKKTAEQLVKDLRDTFTDVLKDIDWMDEGTKAKALEKELAINARVAYPEELLDDKSIEQYYAKLNFSSDNNYVDTMLQSLRFMMSTNINKLKHPAEKNDWTEAANSIQVNAYYAPLSNSIIIPAAILQGVFFNNDRPHYMNYGSMGYAIGHEITHGFDDVGRQYDKNGEVSEWWTEATQKEFKDRTQCIIDQFSNFTVPLVNMHLNGILTQGENIADSGGIKKAYLAYEKWVQRNGEEPRLPGLDYTPRQMFWLSTANVWCIKQRKESLRLAILTDEHSPSEFRIDGSFQNSDYFAKDFNCPAGSRMNPVKKCQIW